MINGVGGLVNLLTCIFSRGRSGGCFFIWMADGGACGNGRCQCPITGDMSDIVFVKVVHYCSALILVV